MSDRLPAPPGTTLERVAPIPIGPMVAERPTTFIRMTVTISYYNAKNVQSSASFAIRFANSSKVQWLMHWMSRPMLSLRRQGLRRDIDLDFEWECEARRPHIVARRLAPSQILIDRLEHRRVEQEEVPRPLRVAGGLG